MPACNVGGTWELAAGIGRIGPDDPAGTYRSGFLQAKTVFRPLQKNSWGIGLTIANQFFDTGWKVVVLEGGGPAEETSSRDIYQAWPHAIACDRQLLARQK